MVKQVELYKIGYGICGYLPLTEISYLLAGENPNTSDLRIGNETSDKVKEFYAWLNYQNVSKKITSSHKMRSGEELYSLEEIFERLNSEKKDYDISFFKVWEQLYQNVEILSAPLSRQIYRHLASLIWEIDQSYSKSFVVQSLYDLQYTQFVSHLPLKKQSEEQLSEILKGLKPEINRLRTFDDDQDELEETNAVLTSLFFFINEFPYGKRDINYYYRNEEYDISL